MVQLKLRTLNLPLIPLILFSEDLLGSFGRPAWLQNVQNEIKAAKTSMGIVDLSSQSVFELAVSDFFSELEISEANVVNACE